MTRRNDEGYGARRVADDCMSVIRRIDTLLATAMSDLIDGDDDTRVAALAINEARSKTFELFAVQSKVARQDLAQAEFLSERAAAKSGTGELRGLLPG